MFADFIDAVDTEAREVRFRIHDDDGLVASAASAAPARSFDITFAGADFTLSDCVARRGPVTMGLGSIEGTVPLDGTYYIAAWVHSGTYETAAYVGAAIANVTDAAVNVDSAWYKVLLYKVERETDDGDVTVRVLVDYREGAGVFLYV
jgi:hypothetical protein